MPYSLIYKHLFWNSYEGDTKNNNSSNGYGNMKIKLYLPSYENVVHSYLVDPSYVLTVY